MNKKLTSKGQVSIELMCMGGAVLIWILLLALGGFSEVFFFILIAYHIIGGLLNRDLAKSLVGAIVLAPVYVGRKVAIYIQSVIVEDNFDKLTTDELVSINHSISDRLERNPNHQKDDLMTGSVYGCSTYGELKEFNARIIAAYNSRK